MKKTILTMIAASVLMPWSNQCLQAQDYRPNPEGYLMERYGVTAWQEEMINWYSWIRSRELDSLKTLDLVPQEYRKERDSVTYIYYARIGRILTEEQKSKFDPEAFKAAKAKEIRILGLPVEKEIAMGKLKAEYDKSVAALSGLPYREMKHRKSALDSEYRGKIKTLLGEEKYGEWTAYKNSAVERKFKEQFGFTDSEFELYKELENRQAVEILVIRNTVTEPVERVGKIAAAKQAKVDSLRVYHSAGAADRCGGSDTGLCEDTGTSRAGGGTVLSGKSECRRSETVLRERV